MLKELEAAIKDMDFKESMEYLCKQGYIEGDGTPIKCTCCGSTNLENYGYTYDNFYLVEYYVRCKDCGEELGTWSYGGWSL